MEKIKVAITQGDTNGIGYKLIFKAFEDPTIFDLCIPIIYGNPKLAAYHRNYYESPTAFHIVQNTDEAQEGQLNLLAVHDEELKVSMGSSNEESRQAARLAFDTALEDFNKGCFDVLINSQTLPGYIGCNVNQLYVSDNFRVMTVSNKKNLKDIPADITKENVIARAKKLMELLKTDFRISNPRIALLSMNADESTEEKEILRPAIDELFDEGVQCFGPYNASIFFSEEMQKDFDAVLAMYEDQAIPVIGSRDAQVSIVYDDGTMIQTTCLPLCSEHSSLLHSISTAIMAYRNHKAYVEAGSNPLPKLYKEHKEGEEHRGPKFQPLDFDKKEDIPVSE